MGAVKILIADDHDAVRRGIRAFLAPYKSWMICGEARDGIEAVEKAKVLQPDIILMDMSMPQMDGIAATRIIQKASPQIAVIMISQNDMQLMQTETTRVGVKGYIEKARLSQELLPTLEALAGKHAELNGYTSQSNSAEAGSRTSGVDLDWVVGGGKMGDLMRSMDWSLTPLGPVSRWPQSLKTSISICLASRFPIVMYWGPEYVVLYNDAYSTILGRKHPWALGQRCRDCWVEIWETMGPMLDSVVSSAQATWPDDCMLMLRRHGYLEECYFSFSFSPIRIETGAVGGVFTAVLETTDKIIGERRQRTLRALAARAVDVSCESTAWTIATETLAENLHDIPFSLLCQLDGENKVQILGAAGIDLKHPLCVSLETSGSTLAQHLQLAAQSREPLEFNELESWGVLPRGAWQSPPEAMVLLPIADRDLEHSSSVFVAAVSPHKRLDENYRTFFQRVAHQIATSVAGARSHDEKRKRIDALAELDQAKTPELLASIVASSDDAIISKSLDGIITSWNESAVRMFGYTAEEAIGQHITLIIPHDRHAEEADILARLRRGERVDHFETVRVRKDGTTFDLSLTISPVKDSRGRVIGASKVARDISERKRIESALRQSEESFRKLSETLDAEVRARTEQLEQRNADILRQAELLRELAHRLLQSQDDERRRIARELHDSAGQTLTVLGMKLAQLVQNTGRTSPQLATDAERIQQTVQQLHREIRTASYLLHPPLLDETGLASALTWYIEGLLERSGLEIHLDIPADFGRLPRDMELLVFRLVQECLTNIHRHSGSQTAAICISRETHQITVEVRDRGKGMSPEKLAEVQTRGSGVGIRGMRERVRQFNGKLDIQSGSMGTRIFVSIPRSPDDLPRQQDETKPLQAAV